MYLKLNLDYLKHYLNNKDIEDEIFKNKIFEILINVLDQII